ncbi:MAG TPA: VOC family protein [Polyangium sp.]|nr:VOC family protein [Polyangium sp.]
MRASKDPGKPFEVYVAGETTMIGYTTVGTNDKDKAAAFYDKLLGALGAKRLMEMDRFILWGTSFGQPGFAIAIPFDGQPATVGNGVMIALAVNSREKVDEIHKLALEMGGKDEGAPGNRGPTFYAGYFRDLDGNKLNAFFMG